MNVDMQQTAILRGDGTPETLEEHLTGISRGEKRKWLKDERDTLRPRNRQWRSFPTHKALPVKRKKGKPGKPGAGVSR